jgi:Putative zincin peptidase
MRPTDQLPSDYSLKGTLDLSKNIPALIGVNLFGVLVLFVGGYLLLLAMASLRPSSSLAKTISVGIRGGGDALVFIVGVIAVMVAVILLHEATHGVFFWLFTGERPMFGLKGLYAYAAAPRWYIPRPQYAVIGLAPLVLLTLLGLVLTLVLPEGLLLPLFAFMLLNASGAAGDIIMVAWLLTRRPGVLARDSGDAISLYEPAG